MAATSAVGTVVMKFGGTSVADAEAIGRLLSIVTAAIRTLDVPPVVVVSATSGTTDQLLALASDAQMRSRYTPFEIPPGGRARSFVAWSRSG